MSCDRSWGWPSMTLALRRRCEGNTHRRWVTISRQNDGTVVSPALRKNLGQCAFRAGDYPEAIRGLSQALKDKPDDTLLVRAQLGMSYFATNQYAQAVKTFASSRRPEACTIARRVMPGLRHWRIPAT